MIEEAECYIKLAFQTCKELASDSDEQLALLAEAEQHLDQALLKLRAWADRQPVVCACGEPARPVSRFCDYHWDLIEEDDDEDEGRCRPVEAMRQAAHGSGSRRGLHGRPTRPPAIEHGRGDGVGIEGGLLTSRVSCRSTAHPPQARSGAHRRLLAQAAEQLR